VLLVRTRHNSGSLVVWGRTGDTGGHGGGLEIYRRGGDGAGIKGRRKQHVKFIN
jgi:hypothetical protein